MTTQEAMALIQAEVAHVWMVRTFVKHSPEAEQHPEVMEIARAGFDYALALEKFRAVSDAEAYVAMARRKLPKLKRAADEFTTLAPGVSDHTNYRQAVASMNASVRRLEEIFAGLAVG